jgi:hypothetical protein
LRAHAARGRAATLVTTARERAVVSVRRGSDDLDEAMGVLAAAEPDAVHGLSRALSSGHPSLARDGELVAVTALLDPTAVSSLLGIGAKRLASVVWIDAASFAGRPTRTIPETLRLAAAGIPVAVVRRGDDLASALGAGRLEETAHG